MSMQCARHLPGGCFFPPLLHGVYAVCMGILFPQSIYIYTINSSTVCGSSILLSLMSAAVFHLRLHDGLECTTYLPEALFYPKPGGCRNIYHGAELMQHTALQRVVFWPSCSQIFCTEHPNWYGIWLPKKRKTFTNCELEDLQFFNSQCQNGQRA